MGNAGSLRKMKIEDHETEAGAAILDRALAPSVAAA
jgi:hypothetical protein